jgi:hypothetical protein
MAMGLFALCLAAVPARGESIFIELAGVAANGPNWDWSYTVKLTNNNSLNSGSSDLSDVWFPDFAEIYDFAGLVGTPVFNANAGLGLNNADFLVTTPNQDFAAEQAIFWPGFPVGPTPSEVTDDQGGANANNIKLSFVRLAPYTNSSGGEQTLGTLVATSTQKFVPNRFDTYIATDTKPSGVSGKNSGTVEVPVVPTPRTVWGGLALFSVMGLVRARRLVGV